MQTERYINSEGAALVLAAIVRQAVDDWRSGYSRADRPDAGAFLRVAGLLVGDGLDPRLKQRPHPQRRRLAAAYARSL